MMETALMVTSWSNQPENPTAKTPRTPQKELEGKAQASWRLGG
jgi:hypothetical protein